MQRRQLILNSAAWAGWTLAALPTAQAAAPELRHRKLIVVMLRGAVDGLSVLAPYGEHEYAASRGSIALAAPGAAGGVLRLNSLFGLHPALSRLMPMWEGGSMSFVHASGLPDATRSHFDAQDFLESGTPGRKSTPDGWMNRLLSSLPGPAGPTRGVNLGNTPPRIWAGSAAVASLGLGPRALDNKAIDSPRLQTALARLYAQDPALAKALAESKEGRAEIQRSMEGAAVAGDRSMDGDRGAPSARSFAADARRLGQLIRRDPNTQLAFTSVGGWDTHVNQGGAEGQLANKLSSLAEGLEALALGLGDAMRGTVIVVCSEFGRTLSQNGTGGTDHGRANVMWLLGGPVAGGQVLGDWPGLNSRALADGRDLAVTTDFRQVFAPLLQRHLGLSDAGLAQVFPNFDRPWRENAALLRA
ncbi:DUF1501 domain-containing protein [Roseateles oligotrophus]|uniref:DUF1501 domain-containing protein n=1 Tax=Roseateles oligotrophus TaxID=1769250 RepID=A0ABT2YB74_9BURK|nr:DUF1501 domain-containing protein [Roseateles oligotrophus]MCV2367546.1 DUF1501 domain-containing protein [Roseateles oligotrophus]